MSIRHSSLMLIFSSSMPWLVFYLLVLSITSGNGFIYFRICGFACFSFQFCELLHRAFYNSLTCAYIYRIAMLFAKLTLLSLYIITYNPCNFISFFKQHKFGSYVETIVIIFAF